MDAQTQQKLVEDVSYLRGRFDTIIPEMQKSSSNINTILQLHKEEIDKLKDQNLVFKTKVAIFGSIAGFVGGTLISILVAVANKFIGKNI